MNKIYLVVGFHNQKLFTDMFFNENDALNAIWGILNNLGNEGWHINRFATLNAKREFLKDRRIRVYFNQDNTYLALEDFDLPQPTSLSDIATMADMLKAGTKLLSKSMDDPFADDLPASITDNGKGVTIADFKKDPHNCAELPGYLSMQQQYSLVLARIRKRPNFTFTYDNAIDQKEALKILSVYREEVDYGSTRTTDRKKYDAIIEHEIKVLNDFIYDLQDNNIRKILSSSDDDDFGL